MKISNFGHGAKFNVLFMPHFEFAVGVFEFVTDFYLDSISHKPPFLTFLPFILL